MDLHSSTALDDHTMGCNWPVVYLLHGNKEIYVGETSNAFGRISQHLDASKQPGNARQKIDTVEIIFDPTFNKSAVLDIENSLIGLLRFEIEQMRGKSKQSRFFDKLQNGNSGQSKLHNYYKRPHYQDEVEDIWAKLKDMQIATNDYNDIVNDTIFKFSPYTSMNLEQHDTCLKILNGIMDALEKTQAGNPTDYTAIVNGEAGTEKTIVLIHLLAELVKAMDSNQTNLASNDDDDDSDESPIKLQSLSEEAKLINRIRRYVEQHGRLRIAYVARMTSLRETIGTVIREIKGVRKKDAKSPFEIVKEFKETGKPFDILLVDEVHRLWRFKKIGSSQNSYSKCCKSLYGENANPADYTELDWLLDCSRTRVLVYDEFQTVKESDIRREHFDTALSHRSITATPFYLKQQMRCRAGMDYVSYLKRVFDNEKGLEKKEFEDYELFYYDDANLLINDIIIKNGQVGLCKVATGYGWQWKRPRYDACHKDYVRYIMKSGTKDTRAEEVKFYLNHLAIKDGILEFNNVRYVRNLDFDWILKGDPREIGCIHTSQGYDLNYVGVLFSPEIDYDPEKGIIIYPKKIKDTTSIGNAFRGLSESEKEQKNAEDQGVHCQCLQGHDDSRH